MADHFPNMNIQFLPVVKEKLPTIQLWWVLAQIIGKCKTRGGESGDKEAM